MKTLFLDRTPKPVTTEPQPTHIPIQTRPDSSGSKPSPQGGAPGSGSK